ncbi:BPTD_2524 family lipoprotein [Pseudomonadota bacterium AL_CKDN230030165-1A_HGKHYDSX7]
MRKQAGLIAAVALTVLAGCAGTGLRDEPGIKETFEVQADFNAAYRRAVQYVRVCHEQRAHPYGAVYVAKTAEGEKGDPNEVRMYRSTEPAKLLELIHALPSEQPGRSNVTVTVLGTGIWDRDEIAAARQSIQSATPVCRALG